MRRCFVIGTLVGALMGAHSAAAAESASVAYPGAGKFYGGVQVDVVNVEAFVTDTQGEPVTGLGPEDFELLVDGQTVPIINFFAVETPDRRQPPAGGDGAEAPAVAVSSPPEEQRLYVVVYVDNTAIRASDRNRVIGHLQELLSRNLGPQDRVMVVTSDPHHTIRHAFTDPQSQLTGVLDSIRHESTGGSFNAAEEQGILRALKRAATRQGVGGIGQNAIALGEDTRLAEAESLLNRIRSYAQWRFDTTRQTVETMRTLLGSLSGLPGRKALMYVGQGASMRIAEPLFDAWVRKFSSMWATVQDAPTELVGLAPLTESNRYNVRRYFEELVTHANISRVTFYSVDASQASTLASVSAEQFGFVGGGQVLARQTFAQQESLQLLAAGTGGRHITNLGNVDRVVQDLQADFDSYYSLGFEPTSDADGRYHSIEVKVHRDDVDVRHRRGFQTKSLDQRMAERLLAALYLDVSPNPLDVSLVTGEREATEHGAYRVPILVKIPIERLVLLPQADEHQGRVTVWVAISDGSGHTPEIHGRRIPVRIPSDRLDEALGQYVGYTVDLVVGKGPRRVALNVRDELASVNSTITFELAQDNDTVTAAAGG